MSFPLSVLWFSFGTSCVATAMMAWHAPGLKPLGRRRADVVPFMAAGLGVGLVVHVPYFAAPFLWGTGYRLWAIGLMMPHVTLVVIVLTSFRWLGRMMTMRHARRAALAFVVSWVAVAGYCGPVVVYLLAYRVGW
jgi:hypothetical protein